MFKRYLRPRNSPEIEGRLENKGKIEILQNKARILRDPTIAEGEEFGNCKCEISQFNESI
jgi:hypothetical protein